MGRASPPLRETPHIHEKGLPRSGGEGAKLKGNEEKVSFFSKRNLMSCYLQHNDISLQKMISL